MLYFVKVNSTVFFQTVKVHL